MEQVITVFKAVILGIIEGITEFLPVSSTGHLIIAEKFISLSDNPAFVAAFEVIIQLGAILSVVIIFWKKLFPYGQGYEHSRKTLKLWLLVITGVIPAAILGFLFDDFIEERLFNPLIVAITLIFYGIVLIIIEKCNKNRDKNAAISDTSTLPFKFAAVIGLFQCLAMIPGTSRSAATIIGGMLLGLSRVAAAEFSFFLAIPTMLGASLLKVIKQGFSFSSFEWAIIAVGFIVSLLVALGVIKLFMNYIGKKDFTAFGWYRIVLGMVVIVLIIKDVLPM